MTLLVTRTRVVAAPLPHVWRVVADLDGYASHVAGLAATTVLSGDGVGARRRCTDTSGAGWEETCVVWQPHERYEIDVDVSTYPARYRLMFRRFRGTWRVHDAPGGTAITVTFAMTLRRIPGLRRTVSALRPRLERDLDAILASYARAVEASPRAA